MSSTQYLAGSYPCEVMSSTQYLAGSYPCEVMSSTQYLAGSYPCEVMSSTQYLAGSYPCEVMSWCWLPRNEWANGRHIKMSAVVSGQNKLVFGLQSKKVS
ncbi:hypothetical protein NHX12_026238 [Muraenolepis orangiensis]|uniref:Uncharacterized protein n=1 Tax=Muraenolepis orangiensis TaxID=630683 RepID=A0A9Q0EH07_9TELE|nr:hypothetical protein NHX12_026238 [Muraenolepis orangiensis]